MFFELASFVEGSWCVFEGVSWDSVCSSFLADGGIVDSDSHLLGLVEVVLELVGENAKLIFVETVLHAAMVFGDLRSKTVSGCLCRSSSSRATRGEAVFARDSTSKQMLLAELNQLAVGLGFFVKKSL